MLSFSLQPGAGARAAAVLALFVSLPSSALAAPETRRRSPPAFFVTSPPLLPACPSSRRVPIATGTPAREQPPNRLPPSSRAASRGLASRAPGDVERPHFPPRPVRDSEQSHQSHRNTADEAQSSNGADPPRATPSATSHTPVLKDLASRVGAGASRRPATSEGATGGDAGGAARLRRYHLGVGKNKPLGADAAPDAAFPDEEAVRNWHVPENPNAHRIRGEAPGERPRGRPTYDVGRGKHGPLTSARTAPGPGLRTTKRLLPKGDEESARLTKAVWDEGHFDDRVDEGDASSPGEGAAAAATAPGAARPRRYQPIDLSVPPSVYSRGASPPPPAHASEHVDVVWDLMRREARAEAAREPLLVSFLHSTILNHPTLESALSFHLANRLSSPAMLSTQVMSLIQQALDEDPAFRRSLRADMLAVRDR